MAIVEGVCDSYLKEMYEGLHTLTDTYKIALYDSSATLGSSTTSYTASGEAVGTGYTAGGIALSGFSASVVNKVSILDFTTDPVWPAITITTRGALIYNSTRANAAVCVLDFGSNVSTTAGDFTIQFPAPTDTTGLIRIS
jgi:hypothetical protein